MKQLEDLFDHITSRINVNLKPMGVDVGPYLKHAVPRERHMLYYAFYALTADHPLSFEFRNSNLAGTYFLGKTRVDRSVLYKSDVRGDELKAKGTVVKFGGVETKLFQDEAIVITNSFLVKTLVHHHSKNPQIPEFFRILNTLALPYANIHGTTTEGLFLAPFATVDFSVLHNCVVGAFSYVQAQDLSHETIEPGRVWIKYDGLFEFNYVYPEGIVDRYVKMDEDGMLTGRFIEFLEDRKDDFNPIYSTVVPEPYARASEGAYVSPYAVVKGGCLIGKNALVAQRSHVQASILGEGSNAQENCYILNSIYDGFNVTAHGGKVIDTHLGLGVFIGFNSFVHGTKEAPIHVGENSIVLPHTIIDAEEPINIPDGSLVWGFITSQADLETQSMPLEELAEATDVTIGNMTFKGDGYTFVKAFLDRINHILEENGAYFDSTDETRGHAQKTQKVSFNILQPFLAGSEEGMFPDMVIGWPDR